MRHSSQSMFCPKEDMATIAVDPRGPKIYAKASTLPAAFTRAYREQQPGKRGKKYALHGTATEEMARGVQALACDMGSG